ncbi:MAG TPA: protein kinase [Gemmatimonadaceae bacterium]|nr:protein kinase [Gemmatimonadaceae bacterium]
MTPPPPTNALEIGLVSSALETDYEVLEELGRGGMAVVYRAREKALDREVAIKVLPAVLSLDNSFVERFEREAKTAAQLEHPSIVPIYRVGRSGQVIFFVMKLLRGQSLSTVLRERKRLTHDEIRHILLDTAGALGYAARRGVVHRDIKPDNILLDHDGRCVITDFGIAKTTTGPLTAQGTSMGTPRYMSPEHAQGQPLDGRSDIYSLGVCAFQCLVGEIPFDGPDPFAVLYKHINSPLPQPTFSKDEDQALFAVIAKMLAKKPEDRFQSADELIVALGGTTSSTSTTLVTGIFSSRLVVDKTEIIPTGAIAHVRRLLNQRMPTWAAIASLAIVTAGGYVAFKLPGSITADTASQSRNTRAPRPSLQSPQAGGIAPSQVVASAATQPAGTPSRSPVPTPKPKPLPESKCPPSPKTLALLMDSIRTQREGTKLQMGYDVCGLTAGAPYSAELSVKRTGQNPVKRVLVGSPQPVLDEFPATANSPRSRSTREVDISSLPPGRYELRFAVTDSRKRRAERVRQFEIRERQ